MLINLIQIYSVPHFVLVNISFEFFSFVMCVCIRKCIYSYLSKCISRLYVVPLLCTNYMIERDRNASETLTLSKIRCAT